MAHFGLTNRDERTAQTRLPRSGLRVSGFDHDGAPHRASVSIEMLALLVEWVAERVCGDTRRNIHIRLGRIRLAKWLWREDDLAGDQGFSMSGSDGLMTTK